MILWLGAELLVLRGLHAARDVLGTVKLSMIPLHVFAAKDLIITHSSYH